MAKHLITVIMAAGKGKRMNNPDKAKVMYKIYGRPLIQYVVELALKINSERIILIVGHQKQSVIDFVNKEFSHNINKIKFAYQDTQLGTGHAIMQTKDYMEDFNGDILILSGDVPLLKYETVNSFLEFHRKKNFDASLVSAVLKNPEGYGRVLRDDKGNFYDIREEKDCSEQEKKCNEINSGIYIINNGILFEALKSLKPENSQGEYYLTDVFKFFKYNGKNIGAYPIETIIEITGVNTVEQLKELEQEISISYS